MMFLFFDVDVSVQRVLMVGFSMAERHREKSLDKHQIHKMTDGARTLCASRFFGIRKTMVWFPQNDPYMKRVYAADC